LREGSGRHLLADAGSFRKRDRNASGGRASQLPGDRPGRSRLTSGGWNRRRLPVGSPAGCWLPLRS